MKGTLFAYSRRGCALAQKICEGFPGQWRLYAPERLAQPPFSALSPEDYGECFCTCDALVFVGACGIAVRAVAPHVKSKITDPAVLCVDECGTFVIPLLSGHIGGANVMANELAARLGAVSVITTATDRSGRFSVDAWAARQGLVIASLARAKDVSAAILERDVGIKSDFPIVSPLPNGVDDSEAHDVGIYLTTTTAEPFPTTLRLLPRVLHLGIGCRAGIAEEAVREAVDRVLTENGLDRRAVRCAASIDLKAKEEGLLSYLAAEDIPVHFYSAQELAAVPGEFTASEFVRKTTGVDNVCERAAMVGACRLPVKKTAYRGVTVAVAAENWEADFG